MSNLSEVNHWATLTEPPKEQWTARKPPPPKRAAFHRTPPPPRDNPWNLSEAEERTLNALLKTGCDLDSAKELGLSHRTVEKHLAETRKKMGVGNRVLQALLWDKWLREKGQ